VGAKLTDAVRIGVFLTDIAGDFQAMNEAFAAYFGDDGAPARAAVGVAALPKGARVEVDAIVAMPG
jgi:2-iminobutanoate/2-iminopropanoate deaminase